MKVPWRHLGSQGAVLATLGKVAIQSLKGAPAKREVVTPGPWVTTTLPPRSPALIKDFVRWAGGDPSAYRGVVPPTMVPQWGFPIAAEAMGQLPYQMVGVLNAGCVLEVRAPLPAGEPLEVASRLLSVDDDGRRAVITVEVVTGTKTAPEAIRTEFRALVRLSKEGGGKKAATLVPQEARELSYTRLDANAGLAFAVLTGDVNPLHWLTPYAKAAGFRAVILHGFGTMARAWEALVRGVTAGDPSAITRMDVRFVKPLLLPGRVGTYQSVRDVWVADAPGGPAYLAGQFSLRGDEASEPSDE